jgi:hypothetical protein
LLKYKEGENKDLGFWFIVAGFWLKEKNQKQQTRDQRLSAIGQKGALCKGLEYMKDASVIQLRPLDYIGEQQSKK